MGIVEFSLRRRVTVAMVALALMMFGGVAFSRLPVHLLPDLTYPSLTVETRLPGAAPAEVEALLTRPIEEAAGVVSGVERLTSVSRPGLSQVSLEFGWGRQMDFAALDVRQKLDLVRLPRESSKPVLLRFDPANDPVLRLYLSNNQEEGGSEDLYQLRYLAEEVLKKDLESTPGLAAVKVLGGFEEEIQVEVDQDQLALLGLSIEEVRDRLARENVNRAGGSLYEKEARYLVRARNEFENLDDIRATVVRAEGDRLVTLADVATVRRGHRRRQVVTRFGGREAVELALYKEGDANTVAMARAVRARLEKLSDELPAEVELATGVDQSHFIEASIREVLSNALVGGLIAILVLLLFLKDLRSTLIIGLSIPLSIIATFFLMYRTGTSLNIMSLGGLALGVGMLVDNAIVVLEAIHRRREAGEEAFAAARQGASEVGRAVAASTLTTVAVFLPVVFLEGVAAQLFRDQALTVSFSLIASLAVSLTVIPMLAALAGGESGRVAVPPLAATAGRWRRGAHLFTVRLPTFLLLGTRRLVGGLGYLLSRLLRPFGWVFDQLLGTVSAAYPRLLQRALGARAVVMLTALVLLAGALWLVPRLGLDLIPTISQGEFAFRVELPEGTPLAVTDRYLAELQSGLADDSRIQTFASTAGGAGLALSNTGTEGENVGRLQVRMASGTSQEDEAAVIAQLRQNLEKVEQARFELERPSVFSFRTPVEIELYGDRLEELHAAAELIKGELGEVAGLVDVKSSAELGNPELQVGFRRDQLARLGLDLAAVAATVRNKVQGDVATRLTRGEREIDILVRSVQLGEATLDDVGNLILAERDGVPIRLKAVADLRLAEGPAEIRRLGQKRAALISADLAGRDMGAVAADLRRLIAKAPLPAGVTADLGGQQQEMERSLNSLLFALALAVFLVYLVMASQFESFVQPLVIIFTLPLGAIGVIGALALSGRTVNVVALIGAVMLAGIVVNNAIVLVDAVNRLRRDQGLELHAALIEAGRQRLRPILMTSATTIFGLLPMALGLGEGAELRAPLAITVIGGLAVATVLTLVVIPVVCSLLQSRSPRRAPVAAPDSAGELAAAPEVAS